MTESTLEFSSYAIHTLAAIIAFAHLVEKVHDHTMPLSSSTRWSWARRDALPLMLGGSMLAVSAMFFFQITEIPIWLRFLFPVLLSLAAFVLAATVFDTLPLNGKFEFPQIERLVAFLIRPFWVVLFISGEIIVFLIDTWKLLE